jgi:protein TonB
MLKPGESLTNVKLIEQTVTQNEQEQPPQHSQAISDRNHTAEKERIPRMPGTLAPPLGKIEEQHSRMAAHMPPAAPEDVAPLKEDHKAKSSAMKNLDAEPKTSKNKQKTRTPYPPNSTQKNTSKQAPDLKPTPREQQIAAGPSPHVGSPDFSPDGDMEEAVVDINTREEKFFSYLLHLKQKIQGVWVYPSSAARAGIGGSLTVEFSVSRNGELLYVNLLDSSGHAILDESALRAIRVAAPYFPFPSRMTAKRLKIRANFVYITGDYFRRIL